MRVVTGDYPPLTERQLKLLQLMRTPEAPCSEDLTLFQDMELMGYWKAIEKHLDFVLETRKQIPNWLPAFKPMF